MSEGAIFLGPFFVNKEGNGKLNSFMKSWFCIFFLFMVFGLLVYFNSLNNRFIIDDYAFLGNPVLSETKFIFPQWDPYCEQALGVLEGLGNSRYYRPMAHMLLNFSYATFKNNLWQYHFLNLFLFVFAASLVYVLIKNLTGNHHLAFLTGLFYLIHPINGIVVNYISASVFALQVIFILGAILLLLGSLERKNNRTLYFFSLLFSFLSVFWHESGIMTPFYVSMAVLLFKKGSLKEKTFCLLPYFLISAAYLVFRLNFLGTDEHILKKMVLYHMGVGEYLAALFRVYAWYIGKLFYPGGIVMQWATPILHDHIIPNVLGLCLLFMVFLFLFLRFFKQGVCRLAMTWLFIGFAPVCLAAFRKPENGAMIEPHWFVFSSIGFFILASYFCLFVLGRMKNIGFILLSVLIVAWGAVSYAYNQLWVDQKTYAFYWSQQVPNLKSTYLYLAEAYMREGDLKDSRKYCHLALSGGPLDAQAYINLGVIDRAYGHFKDAESKYKMAMKFSPNSAIAYNNLASVYFAEGRLDKAAENFRQSLALNPLLLKPRIGLVSIFLKHSEYQKAVDLCLKNLDIAPHDTDTLLMLIDIYAQKNDFADLKKYAYRIINDETDPEILMRLGDKVAAKNLNDVALQCYRKVLRVAPGYKNVSIKIAKAAAMKL